MIRLITVISLICLSVSDLHSQLIKQIEVLSPEEREQYLNLKSGERITFLRNGTKLLTDEFLLYGNDNYKRTVRVQRIWIDDKIVVQTDTYLDSPIRYTYSHVRMETTEFLDDEDRIFMIKSLESDFEDAFTIDSDNMLVPFSDSKWKDWFVPREILNLKKENRENQSAHTTPASAPR